MASEQKERLSRPVYESLPWLYEVAGMAALVGSYLTQHYPAVSVLMALGGFASILWGIVIWLRRRDYRDMRARYRG